MIEAGWSDAGQGWQGKEAEPWLTGWSGKRRVIVPRRAVPKDIAVVKEDGAGNQLELYFGGIDPGHKGRVFEYAVLVTSLANEVLMVAQLYRDRADVGNVFDEVKNHWGWGGFVTGDVKRCRLTARFVALVYNWWSLFVRLADPDRHTEALTSRELLLYGVGRRTQHGGQRTITISFSDGRAEQVRRALAALVAFFASLKETAEQSGAPRRWYRILSRALIKYLKGRQLRPPELLPAAQACT